MSATTVWHLPYMSQESHLAPKLRQDPGDQLAIAYDFEQTSGEYEWEEVLFTGVLAFTFTTARHCSEDQVAAYDRLQVVAGTDRDRLNQVSYWLLCP